MIAFMIIALPRSGTTWAANWLTSAESFCHHDPLYTVPYRDWDRRLGAGDRPAGVACTGIHAFPAWLNAHPARKVILHRPLAEIEASMAALDLAGPTTAQGALLDQVDGLHRPWTDLFHPSTAFAIAEHLGLTFDADRHQLLRQMQVQPHVRSVVVDRPAARANVAEMHAQLAR